MPISKKAHVFLSQSQLEYMLELLVKTMQKKDGLAARMVFEAIAEQAEHSFPNIKLPMTQEEMIAEQLKSFSTKTQTVEPKEEEQELPS